MSTVLRKRRNQRSYNRYAKQVDTKICAFCAFKQGHPQIREELAHFWVVENMFGYDMWDSTGVEEHLMLVPKRHVIGLHEYSAHEQKEFFKALEDYETRNYSIYARSPGNIRKSVTHQHTHLIKIDSRPKRVLFYLRKPHLLWMK